jgi:hypothetical protein
MSVEAFLVAWAVVAVVIAAVGVLLATRNGRVGFIGVIVDGRGRCSLTKLQLTLWSVILISLFASTAWQRGQTAGFAAALDFSIPSELLGVLGISLGSAAAATAVKSSRDGLHADRVLVWRASGREAILLAGIHRRGSFRPRPARRGTPALLGTIRDAPPHQPRRLCGWKGPHSTRCPSEGFDARRQASPLDSSLNE